jgi:hypothetical protein
MRCVQLVWNKRQTGHIPWVRQAFPKNNSYHRFSFIGFSIVTYLKQVLPILSLNLLIVTWSSNFRLDIRTMHYVHRRNTLSRTPFTQRWLLSLRQNLRQATYCTFCISQTFQQEFLVFEWQNFLVTTPMIVFSWKAGFKNTLLGREPWPTRTPPPFPSWNIRTVGRRSINVMLHYMKISVFMCFAGF